MPAFAVSPAVDCAALATFALPDTQITSAVPVAAGTLPGGATDGSVLPAYCKLLAVIDQRIRFDLRLPTPWNRRFFFQGGVGTDGVIFEPLGLVQGLAGASGSNGSALSRSFAVVSTDAGHQGFTPAFGLDPQARIDFAYRALDVVTRRAKEIAAHFYGRPVKRSYFIGCSNGGRQAMLASQRFPEHFDGVVAANPGFNLTEVTIGEAWDTIALTAAAPTDGSGAPILAQALSDADLALLANAVLTACDDLDGLADGIIDAHSACRFDPATLACPGAKTPSCLSAVQVDAVSRVFGGAHDSSGTPLYAEWPWDPGIGGSNWRAWKLGLSLTSVPNALNLQVGLAILRYVFFTPPDPSFDPLRFDFDTDPARTLAAAAMVNATSTDLTAFARRRSKLLLYTGLGDPVFSANALRAYYDGVVTAHGGLASTQRFARLFLVPGMNHCSGGPALDRFDALTAIVRWVEKGRAPARLVATGDAFPGRSRPLCPYPREARYRRRGNSEEAASFRCVLPN
jgi:feruloyl esterase